MRGPISFAACSSGGDSLRRAARFSVTGWVCAVFLLMWAAPLKAQSPYQLKAAVLGNLAKFVEWPAAAFSSPEEPIRLGVLGEDPFGPDLETILTPMKVRGRSFVFVRSRDVDELASCHMLFTALQDVDELRRVLGRVKGRPMLLVGEDPKFLEVGGMVRFHMEDRKVRFAINAVAAEGSGLSMHPQLLKLATSVKRGEATR